MLWKTEKYLAPSGNVIPLFGCGGRDLTTERTGLSYNLSELLSLRHRDIGFSDFVHRPDVS
jgi:hypothetical protein